MNSEGPVYINYVFLDVEGFTRGRSTEAQADVIKALNQGVLKALDLCRVNVHQRILIPTGDGVCIALLRNSSFDLQVRVALAILKQMHERNRDETRDSRKFKVRIGINANHDNIVTDVNKRRNVAGAGINLASRIMDLADGGNILLGDSVHAVLSVRDKYQKRFTSYDAQVKHGGTIAVHQLIGKALGLSDVVPKRLQQQDEADLQLDRTVAWYMALALRFKPLLLMHNGDAACWLWLRALDQVAEETAAEEQQPTYLSERQMTDEEQLLSALKHPWAVRHVVSQLLEDHVFARLSACFVRTFPNLNRFLTPYGQEKLQRDHPDVHEWASTQTENADDEVAVG